MTDPLFINLKIKIRKQIRNKKRLAEIITEIESYDFEYRSDYIGTRESVFGQISNPIKAEIEIEEHNRKYPEKEYKVRLQSVTEQGQYIVYAEELFHKQDNRIKEAYLTIEKTYRDAYIRSITDSMDKQDRGIKLFKLER